MRREKMNQQAVYSQLRMLEMKTRDKATVRQIRRSFMTEAERAIADAQHKALYKRKQALLSLAALELMAARLTQKQFPVDDVPQIIADACAELRELIG